MTLTLKRIYEEAESKDGYRVLVDRLWPRGVKKEDAKVDQWLKQIAPSSELRKWFSHDPEKFSSFQEKYIEELETEPEKQEAVNDIKKLAQEKRVTLLYAAKDSDHNHAIVIKNHIMDE